MAVLLRLIFHQIITGSTVLLVLKGKDVFIILPEAVADHIIIGEDVHVLSVCRIEGDKPCVLSLTDKPPVQNHAPLSARTKHEMVNLMDRTGFLHFRARLEGCKVFICEQRLNATCGKVNLPHRRSIRQSHTLRFLRYIVVTISGAKVVET